MTRLPILRRIRRDRRGVTAVEFALIALPLFTMIMGTLDLGYQVYLRSVTSGALERASRAGVVGNRTRTQLEAQIRTELRNVLPATGQAGAVTVTPRNYFNFSSIGRGERITTDTIPLGRYNTGDCYEDRNNNFRYDATSSAADTEGLGGADDITFYDVKVSVPRLFPIARIIGWNPNAEVNVRTLVRNQPYGNQAVIIRCQ